MINDQVIEEIKTHLEDYLKELGLNTKKLFNCLNPEHNDKHPSMSYDDKKNIVHCFSCNSSYDIISLYALNNNLDNNKDFKKIVEDLSLKYGIKNNLTDKEQRNNYINAKKTDIKKVDYTKYINKCKKDSRNIVPCRTNCSQRIRRVYKVYRGCFNHFINIISD
jgi:DNA primase